MKRFFTTMRRSAALESPRRGIILVLTSVALIAALAFAAFSVDLGYIAVTKSQLQNASDSAALAGAIELDPMADDQDTVRQNIQSAAITAAALNEAGDWQSMALDGADIEVGRREWNPGSQSYSVQWGSAAQPYNLVKVTARRGHGEQATDDGSTSQDTRLPLFFAPILGHKYASVEASAVATFQARDVMLVLDYSASMNDDSEYVSIPTLGKPAIEANISQMWNELGNPTYGNLTNFTPDYLTAHGVPLNVPSMIPHVSVKWRGTAVDVVSTHSLTQIKLQFTTGSTQTITPAGAPLSGTYQGSGGNSGKVINKVWVKSWQNAVKFPTNGEPFAFDDAALKTRLGLNSVPYPYASGSWDDFIDYTVSYNSSMPFYTSAVVNNGYLRKFGLQTLINFWNDEKPKYSQTNSLWQVSQQPVKAMKDGSQILVDYMSEVATEDQLGLVVYTDPANNGARLEAGLSQNYNQVYNLLTQRQAGHYDYYTNIGAGIREGRIELENNARLKANRMIVLLTDGLANQPGSTGQAKNYVVQQAQLAAQAKIRIMTISLGAGADTSLMQQVADMTGGTHFNVPGGTSAAVYTQQLREVFREIAADRALKLLGPDAQD